MTWQCFFSHFSLPIIPLESCCHCLNAKHSPFCVRQRGHLKHSCIFYSVMLNWSTAVLFMDITFRVSSRSKIFIPTMCSRMFVHRFFIQRNKREIKSFWMVSVQSKTIKQFLIFVFTLDETHLNAFWNEPKFYSGNTLMDTAIWKLWQHVKCWLNIAEISWDTKPACTHTVYLFIYLNSFIYILY